MVSDENGEVGILMRSGEGGNIFEVHTAAAASLGGVKCTGVDRERFGSQKWVWDTRDP